MFDFLLAGLCFAAGWYARGHPGWLSSLYAKVNGWFSK